MVVVGSVRPVRVARLAVVVMMMMAALVPRVGRRIHIRYHQL